MNKAIMSLTILATGFGMPAIIWPLTTGYLQRIPLALLAWMSLVVITNWYDKK